MRDGEFAHLDEADALSPGSLAFCLDRDYLRLALGHPNVSCVIVTPELAREANAKGVVAAADPRLEFFRLYRKLAKARAILPQMDFGRGRGVEIHPSAVVSQRTRIGDEVTICAGAVVDDYVSIGSGSYVGHGAVVGADGMLTVRDGDAHLQVPHAGGIEIGAGVMLLASSVVVRSLYRRNTRVGEHSQIGIRASVGHGARLGARCIVSVAASIGGRVSIGDEVRIGMDSSIVQGASIGSRATIRMGSIVVTDVPEGGEVSGNFAVPHGANLRQLLRVLAEARGLAVPDGDAARLRTVRQVFEYIETRLS